MAKTLELFFNPQKKLKRADVIKLGGIIMKKMKDKKVQIMSITITDDRKDGANSMTFPFIITDEK